MGGFAGRKNPKPLRARCCEHAQCPLPSERQARRGEYVPVRSETVACLTAINPSLSLTLSWNEFYHAEIMSTALPDFYPAKRRRDSELR
jgi:hypothetical protein